MRTRVPRSLGPRDDAEGAQSGDGRVLRPRHALCVLGRAYPSCQRAAPFGKRRSRVRTPGCTARVGAGNDAGGAPSPAARQSARGADSASRVLRGGPTCRFRPLAHRTLLRPPRLGRVPGHARRGHEHARSVRRAGGRVAPHARLPRFLEPGLLCRRGAGHARCCDRALAERAGALPGRTLSPDCRPLDDADASRGAHGRHR